MKTGVVFGIYPTRLHRASIAGRAAWLRAPTGERFGADELLLPPLTRNATTLAKT